MLRYTDCKGRFLVDVIMPTFNHENYVAKAIQSVLMQECSFGYRLIIGEDCSNDGTLRICELFAHENPGLILLLKNLSNIGIAANYKSLFNISSSKYIAILEGDDYWIDRHKLQKQVEVLESRSEIGLVHTNYYSFYESGKMKKGHVWEKTDLLSGNVIGPTQTANININPLTTCFRSFLAKENVDFDFIINNKLLTVDIFLWAEICRRSNVLYIDEVTGVYRIHSNSITGNTNINSVERFSRTSLLMVNYLMEKYETPKNVKRAFYSKNKIDLVYRYLLANQSSKAYFELDNIKDLETVREKIIYLSAKYRQLNFLSKMLARFFDLGSNFKQAINRVIGSFNHLK